MESRRAGVNWMSYLPPTKNPPPVPIINAKLLYPPPPRTKHSKSETRRSCRDKLDYNPLLSLSGANKKALNPIAFQRAEGSTSTTTMQTNLSTSPLLRAHECPTNNESVRQSGRRHSTPSSANAEVSYVTPSCVTKARGELGKKTSRISPPANLQKTLFVHTPSSAPPPSRRHQTRTRLYTGRHKIFALNRAFHGSRMER